MFSPVLRDDSPFHGDDRRIRSPYLDSDPVLGLVAFGGRGDVDGRDTGSGRLKVESDQFVPWLAERDNRPGIAVDSQRSVNGHSDLGVLHLVLKREDVDRHRDFLTCAEDSWKSRQNHKRRSYRDGLFRVAVGSGATCHKHHLHAAYIHRKLDLVCGCAALKRERTDVSHDSVEPVVLFGSHNHALVTSDAEHRREPSAVGSYDIVIQIPGADTKGFPSVHGVPRIRGLVARYVKQSFVHNRQRVGHRLAVLLLDLDREFLLRAQYIRHVDDRLKMGILVVDQDRAHAVEPDREIVVASLVWLDQSDMHIEVRRHLRRDLE